MTPKEVAMDNNTAMQGNNESMEQQNTQPQTFTQEDVNRIVSDRLRRDRAERADYDELKAKAAKFDEMESASKSELEKAKDKLAGVQAELNALKKAQTVRDIRDSVAKETGVPASLLTAESEDECRQQAEGIQKYAKANNYPSVRDGGEPTGAGVAKSTTRQQFADWLNGSE